VGGFVGWLAPLAVAGVVAALLVIGPLGLAAGAQLRPSATDWRTFWGFALPRAASVAIDAGSMWVGVLLTAALAGQAEAGVFAAVGRYALAGLLIMQGLRVAVAPQLSRLLGADRRAEAVAVYRRTTLWIVLLSWPAYLLLAVFAPAFLWLFGSQFAAGATPMAVLAVAMLVNVGVGLVQTVLLMSGNSRGHLLACVTGLALNLTACLVLIPRHGALGAAVAWSIGIVVENVLAAVLARRALGQPLVTGVLLRAAAAVTAGTGAACAVGVAVGGRGLPGLALALGVLTVVLLALLGNGRVRAAVADVRSALRPAANPATTQEAVP
jgi:O-antigen/teichoic acid export membrane protein